jgi:hypothetical protein
MYRPVTGTPGAKVAPAKSTGRPNVPDESMLSGAARTERLCLGVSRTSPRTRQKYSVSAWRSSVNENKVPVSPGIRTSL